MAFIETVLAVVVGNAVYDKRKTIKKAAKQVSRGVIDLLETYADPTDWLGEGTPRPPGKGGQK